MIIFVLAEYFVGGRWGNGVECYEKRLSIIDILQPVHPIADGHDIVATLAVGHIVPSRPGHFALRHQAFVAVQKNLIGQIANRTDNFLFLGRSIGKNFHCLVAMAGENYFVKMMHLAIGGYFHAVCGAGDLGYFSFQSQTFRKSGRDFCDIFAAAAGHRAPDRPIAIDEAMIVKELQKAGGRKIHDFVRRC